MAIIQRLRSGHAIATVLDGATEHASAQEHQRRTVLQDMPVILPSISESLRQQAVPATEELFDLLRSISEEQSQSVLQRIRAGDSVPDILRLVKNGSLKTQLSLVPQIHRLFEFPYIHKVPDFLGSVHNPYRHTLSLETNSGQHSIQQQVSTSLNHPGLDTVPYFASEIVDPYLWNLKASAWTSVTCDDNLVSRILNSYFLHHYSIYLGFQKDFFLKDMANQRHQYCSMLLVNTLLAAGCHTWTDIPDRAQFWNPLNLAYRFLAEAKRLWEVETQAARSSLTTIQAAIVLNTIYDADTMDKVGKMYMLQAIAMAHDMKLFKDDADIKSKRMRRARAFTAWCLYTWDAMQSFYYRQEPLIREPPDTPIPDVKRDPSWYGEIWVRYPLSSTPVPTHFGSVANATMELRSLMHAISRTFFNVHRTTGNPSRETIDGFCQSLDAWFRQLPSPLTANAMLLPSHIRVHTEYYSLLISLRECYQSAIVLPTADDTNTKAIATAYIMLETLVRLCYLRHGHDAFDSFLTLFLFMLGNNALGKLANECDARTAEEYRATLVFCARGLHKQGQHMYMTRMVYLVLRGKMQPRDLQLVLTYVKEAAVADPKQITRYNQSSYPVPIIKINEDPRTATLENLIGQYEDLSLEISSTASSSRMSEASGGPTSAQGL
ncbi:hypothetical protein MY10362_008848 [Beauveria mimosiformis]